MDGLIAGVPVKFTAEREPSEVPFGFVQPPDRIRGTMETPFCEWGPILDALADSGVLAPLVGVERDRAGAATYLELRVRLWRLTPPPGYLRYGFEAHGGYVLSQVLE